MTVLLWCTRINVSQYPSSTVKYLKGIGLYAYHFIRYSQTLSCSLRKLGFCQATCPRLRRGRIELL